MSGSCLHLSRRKLLLSALAAGAAPLTSAWADDVPPIAGPAKKVTLAWMPTAICHIAVPVADKQGFFKKNNLDVEFVNWAGSTDMLLEAISTGHADAGIGMALRWLKPMEQGFDVKITAGTHGGCMKVLTSPDSGLKSISDLRHKRLGVGDIGGVDKNFFSIVLHKKGIDPNSEVEWKQFPADMLGQALKKGEIDALSTSDPLAFILKRDNGLIEIANNLENGYENLACCILGIRGSLIRNDKPTAAAITRALIEAAEWTDKHPDEAGEIYAPYAPKQRAKDLSAMLKSSITSNLHPVRQDLQAQVASYVDDLKSVGVIKPSVDAAKFAGRICLDVFA